jgi:hypothetical protein
MYIAGTSITVYVSTRRPVSNGEKPCAVLTVWVSSLSSPPQAVASQA